MTKLDCNVTSCVHNADNCCCKQEIYVEGQGRARPATPAAEASTRARTVSSKICSSPRRAAWRSSVRR